MSFNSNDRNSLKISRTNYEEFFLLYVDDELSEEQKLEVEQFVALHPDLAAELEMLITTKLPGEVIEIEDKQMLMADHMKLNAVDEALLLYVDNELSESETVQFEQRLFTDQNLQLQYQLLLKTKLQPSPAIRFPHKQQLYRRTTRRIVPVWMRIAAAVLLTVGAGGTIFFFQQGNESSVAVKPNNSEQHLPASRSLAEPGTTMVADAGNESKPAESTAAAEVKNEVTYESKYAVAKARAHQPNASFSNSRQPQVAPTKPVQEENINVADNMIAHQQTVNTPDVTSAPVVAYNTTEASLLPAVERDVAAQTDYERKSSLKGFLRKATRFIERRANIRTTNEDDELLIGAVAVKL
jgi:hypothetical protein